MINEKCEEKYKQEFGRLMYKYAVISRVIRDYDRQLKACRKDIDKLMNDFVGKYEESSDGESVQ